MEKSLGLGIEMSNLEYVKLSEEEISRELEKVPGWAIENGLLARAIEFPTYLAGVDFAANVGRVAEALDHHPDIHIGWRKVRITVNTHAVEGISPYDFELARRVDLLLDA